MQDFVDRLCVEPIRDYQPITEVDALGLIAEYL
jgi:hypothetical protein